MSQRIQILLAGILLYWLVCLFAIPVGCASAPVISRLRTEQTFIELQAQASAPKLVRLALPGKTAWWNHAPESLIGSAEIDGQLTKLFWAFNPKASRRDGQSVAFIYDCAHPHLRLTWEWKATALNGPVEHTTRIENRDTKEIWIPLQNSFTFAFSVEPNRRLKHFYIEKGAGKPSAIGTHESELSVGYRWNGASSTYAHAARDQAREIIPWFAVEETDRSQTGWYVGMEFSGRTRMFVERTAKSVEGAVGLNGEPGPFRTRLKPQDAFETPPVFLGAYSEGLDGLGNVLRPWVRNVLGNPHAWRDPHYPLLVNNSWGSGMQVDETLARRMIRDSAELGLEMFHIDAGWFRGVGDWYPDPKKFPHGLAAIAEEAHRYGLRFGIWVDWTQAGMSRQAGALNVNAPEVHNWTVSDLPPNWKPEPFKGQTIDIGDPAAQAYAQREVNRLVEDYHLDMLEHDGYLVAQGCVRGDHPHAPPDRSRLSVEADSGNYIVQSSNSTDVSYHAVKAYYAIHSQLRRDHPNLLLEICNDGGRMVDFGSAAHGDYFSITDAYDPLSNRRAFYDASHLLPPAMLEAYVEKWPTPKIENFRYMLRSGMMGWLTIMLDTTAWSEQEHAAAKKEIQLYKKRLRPLIRDAALYHIAPRPDGIHWDGLEYFDPQRDRGVLYAFRGSNPSENTHVFKLRGLAPAKNYRLHFEDGIAPNRSVTGRDLLDLGLSLTLPIPNSSELVFIESK
ncbi:MAG: alpha-galactosidase [Acidobacteriaceae bacterium]|nr:alpha-galactosidase [Acidobacteriaceae bacterium]